MKRYIPFFVLVFLLFLSSNSQVEEYELVVLELDNPWDLFSLRIVLF